MRIVSPHGKVLRVVSVLGSGAQGDIYKVEHRGRYYAVKCINNSFLSRDKRIIHRISNLIEMKAPDDNFIWPITLVKCDSDDYNGYLMDLLPQRFINFVKIMNMQAYISFKNLINSAINLVNSFLNLHSLGLSYRDISFNNIFVNPKNGDIRIIDNDNVDFDREKGIITGTPKFIAPEIILGKAMPSTETDLYSLSVLLFYMFFVHHPLEGKQELEIKCLDLPAMKKLYGTHAVFIYDPQKPMINPPVMGYHDNAIIFWKIYPEFFKRLFTRAFTEGLRNPSKRVRESEWRMSLYKLRDLIVYCPKCGAENFFDYEKNEMANNSVCWNDECKFHLSIPLKIKIDDKVIILNKFTELFPHHIDSKKMYDFSSPVAKVLNHPHHPNIFGLKNLAFDTWYVKVDGKDNRVFNGQSVIIKKGVEINFQTSKGVIY